MQQRTRTEGFPFSPISRKDKFKVLRKAKGKKLRSHQTARSPKVEAVGAQQKVPFHTMDNSTVTYLPPISELATQSVKFYAVIIAAACTILAVGMSTWQMIQHLRNFNKPTLQRCIVRIILMIPVRIKILLLRSSLRHPTKQTQNSFTPYSLI